MHKKTLILTAAILLLTPLATAQMQLTQSLSVTGGNTPQGIDLSHNVFYTAFKQNGSIQVYNIGGNWSKEAEIPGVGTAAMDFSPNNNWFAYTNSSNNEVIITSVPTWTDQVAVIPNVNPAAIEFSMDSNFLAILEIVSGPAGLQSQINIYDTGQWTQVETLDGGAVDGGTADIDFSNKDILATSNHEDNLGGSSRAAKAWLHFDNGTFKEIFNVAEGNLDSEPKTSYIDLIGSNELMGWAIDDNSIRQYDTTNKSSFNHTTSYGSIATDINSFSYDWRGEFLAVQTQSDIYIRNTSQTSNTLEIIDDCSGVSGELEIIKISRDNQYLAQVCAGDNQVNFYTGDIFTPTSGTTDGEDTDTQIILVDFLKSFIQEQLGVTDQQATYIFALLFIIFAIALAAGATGSSLAESIAGITAFFIAVAIGWLPEWMGLAMILVAAAVAAWLGNKIFGSSGGTE